MNRVTPEKIILLERNQVFVFGSNEAGIDAAGAALQAYKSFGAKWGMGFGRTLRTFAIPTKDWEIQTLPLHLIGFYVRRFIAYTKTQPQYTFLVTKIGCGLAGYDVDQIAPYFHSCRKLENVWLPESFWNILNQE